MNQQTVKKLDVIVRKIVLNILKVFHKENQEELVSSLAQFIKFCIVGATNTLVSYCVNVLILKLLQPYGLSWNYIAGNIIAFVIGTLWSYIWNNRFVFSNNGGQKKNGWHALIKTYVTYGFTGVIVTNILSYVWIDLVGISRFIAPLINLVVTIPINFLINKYWAFK